MTQTQRSYRKGSGRWQWNLYPVIFSENQAYRSRLLSSLVATMIIVLVCGAKESSVSVSCKEVVIKTVPATLGRTNMLQRCTMQLHTFPGKGSSQSTYLELKQWAAVTTHSLARTAPPQICSSEICTLTCQGHEYGTASSPPIILLKMNLGWFEGIPQISETESSDVSRSL